MRGDRGGMRGKKRVDMTEDKRGEHTEEEKRVDDKRGERKRDSNAA